MSLVIRDGKEQPEASLTLIADDAPLPADGRALVSLERWQAEAFASRAADAPTGVRIPNTADIEQIWPVVSTCPLINLDFPSFGDGRAYSQARLLRDRFGYQGDIRASGAAVVADQIHGMLRCGISSFELRADQDVQTCLKAMHSFSGAYQPAADQILPVGRLRASASA